MFFLRIFDNIHVFTIFSWILSFLRYFDEIRIFSADYWRNSRYFCYTFLNLDFLRFRLTKFTYFRDLLLKFTFFQFFKESTVFWDHLIKFAKLSAIFWQTISILFMEVFIIRCNLRESRIFRHLLNESRIFCDHLLRIVFSRNSLPEVAVFDDLFL